MVVIRSMIEVQIRTPRFDKDLQAIEWETLARICVENGDVTVGGDEMVVHMGCVASPSLGKSVHPGDDPQEWARNLPYAYRGGDLVAAVVQDHEAPIVDPVADEGIGEPEIPVPADAPAGTAAPKR